MSSLIAQFPAYSSCRKGEYRLSGHDLDKVQHELFLACTHRAKDIQPCRVFQSLPYLGSGWEWSAFKNNDAVVKIPAGIFPETADSRYLENTKYNYSVIKRYVEHVFIAETEFLGAVPSIRQQLLQCLPEKILFCTCDTSKWGSLFEQLLRLLEAEHWLPDLDIRQSSDGFTIRSIMMDATGTPKLMDFTAYFDVFRLYEERMHHEVGRRRQVLEKIIDKLRCQHHGMSCP